MTDIDSSRPSAGLGDFKAVLLGSAAPPLLSTVQAAARMNLRPCTLEKWRSTGGGPVFIKLGRAVKYRAEDIDAFIGMRVRRHTASPSIGS